MKKIAYFLGVFPQKSGAFIFNQITELKKQGFDVHIFSLDRIEDLPEGFAKDTEDWPITYIKEGTNLQKTLLAHIQFLLTAPVAYLRLWADVLKGAVDWRIFAKYVWVASEVKKLDVYVVHSYFAEGQAVLAMIVSRLTGKPFSFKIGGTGHYLDERRHKELRPILARSAFTVVVSDELRRNLSSRFPEFADKIIVNTSGIDLKRFDLGRKRFAKGNVLFVGRQVEHKGVRYLLEAAKLLKVQHTMFSLTIIGEGEQREEFEMLSRELDLLPEVKFLGAMPNHQIVQHLHEATVFAFPSYFEGTPVVLMEAMASGTPVISTRSNGIPDMIDDGVNGYLIDSKNSEQLAEKIKTLLADLQLARVMGDKAREYADRYSIEARTAVLIGAWVKGIRA